MSINLVVVGCGAHARAAHGPALKRYAERHDTVRLAACCDLDERRAERFAREFGFAAWYGDADRMLRTENPGALLLVVPPEKTCEMACRMMERGIPLLMEKPPGTSATETDRMIEVARRRAAPQMVATNRRFMPLTRTLKEWLVREPPGSVRHIDYEFTRVGRRDRDFSTTAFHGIDAVRFLAASDYAHVRFTYQPLLPAEPSVANVLMDGVMASGATVHLRFLPLAGAVVERATVYADDRTYCLQMPVWQGLDAPGRLLRVEKGAIRAEIPGEPGSAAEPLNEAMGFYGENAAFLDALSSGCAPEPGLADTRQSVELTACFRERRPAFSATPRPPGA